MILSIRFDLHHLSSRMFVHSSSGLCVQLFSDIVTRLASQSKTEMHVVFFAVASTLSVTMGVHIVRMMCLGYMAFLKPYFSPGPAHGRTHRRVHDCNKVGVQFTRRSGWCSHASYSRRFLLASLHDSGNRFPLRSHWQVLPT